MIVILLIHQLRAGVFSSYIPCALSGLAGVINTFNWQVSYFPTHFLLLIHMSNNFDGFGFLP